MYVVFTQVREHNRKARKEAKKHPKSELFPRESHVIKLFIAGLKKDPGIPNLFPLKEQLLKQLEEKKQAAQSQREREKQQRLQEAKKNKNKKKRSLQGLQNDAQQRTREFEKKV